MITKNKQSNEIIQEMAKVAFPNKSVISIKELTEGMCNVTYLIVFDDASESILKIAAKDTTGNTSNEINLMKAEVSAMRLVSKKCSFKVADVQYYDCSRAVCVMGTIFSWKNCRVITTHLLKINCLKMLLQF